jgi:anti-sigma-K factor RskA
MSTDLHTLSGAYALDALSAEEAEQFRRHLDDCPACRDEVRELRQAAARMGASQAIAPPASLKARVLAAADQLPQLPPEVTPIEHARSRRWSARIAAAAAAVALVVAAGFGIGQLQNSDEGSNLAQPVAQVFEARDAHKATIETSNGGTITVATSREPLGVTISARIPVCSRFSMICTCFSTSISRSAAWTTRSIPAPPAASCAPRCMSRKNG